MAIKLIGIIMETIVNELNKLGITNPSQIKVIAELIVKGSTDEHISTSAFMLCNSNDHAIEQIRQQVMGGR